TLFLDEVGDLNLDAQAKLLRFMEDGQFYKVGSTEIKKVTTRIVSATNKNLEEMIQKGSYRRDLFYRIGVIKIQVPSLNERDEDVLIFAKYFLQMFNEKFDRSLTGISELSQDLLKNFTWKGNVREMRNMIERAVLTAKGPELTPEDLGLSDFVAGASTNNIPPLALEPLSPEGVDLDAMKTYMDEFYFSQAMALAKGNETRAAILLKLKHHAFRYQYKKILEKRATEDQKTASEKD
uniref:sigma 54-interacting transcriptional regulator n=1 Tax=Desulfosarcina sp. TaxID=2027861 RepID=UPI00356874BF